MTLSTGTVTFLFTDIEGSTKLWEEQPDAMQIALERHDVLMRNAIETNGGTVFKTMGDAFCAAFETAPEALEAALSAQQSLHQIPGGVGAGLIKVRMALHTGAAERRNEDYFGQPLNRVARLLAAGHGGQVLLSQATYILVRDRLPKHASLTDMGEHRLKDLHRPEQVYQLQHPDLDADFPPLKSLDHLPTNLPRQLTSFIGREKEMAEINALLEKTSLLTLTGSGGCGKTRLSLQVAVDVMDQYSDGVWLVELAPVTDPGLVPQTAAQALGVQEAPGQPITKTLLLALKDKQMLLVLDNCEHLLDASARFVDAILRGCPKVKVMVSSREGLGIAGETTYRVPSLSVPDPKQPQTPENLSHFEAVALFIDRASQVQTGFVVTNHNAPALASVCNRLDGIPLAIELAAARVRALPIEEINNRLDKRFRLLTGGSRTALPRQQTLRAMIDWSYDLLSESEKALLCRLAVFAGGWTLEAAEAVCTGDGIEEWETLDLLTSMVDKSLAVYELRERNSRYRLLETVRQYARDRLVESGKSEAVRARHVEYFLSLAEETVPQPNGPDRQSWLDQMELEHENLTASLDWSLLNGVASEGIRLCSAFSLFCVHRGHYLEGRDWCTQFIDRIGSHQRNIDRIKMLLWAAQFALREGDYTSASCYAGESLAISREIENEGEAASSLGLLGEAALSQGDYASACKYLEESLNISRVIGDTWQVSMVLNSLGLVAHNQGEYDSAIAYHEESLSIRREIVNLFGIAQSLNNLGCVAASQRDTASARAYFRESLDIRTEIGFQAGIAAELFGMGYVAYLECDYKSARTYYAQALNTRREIEDRLGSAESLEASAALALVEGRSNLAATLWGSAEALRATMGSPMPPNEKEQYDREIAEARIQLGEELFSAAWAEGRTLTMEEAIELALEEPPL